MWIWNFSKPAHSNHPRLSAVALRLVPNPVEEHGFILTGFHQEHGIRHYVFQCPNNNGTSSEFTVEADVRMLRKYGIGLQELPLLCRHLLEKQNHGSPVRAVTFGEDLMRSKQITARRSRPLWERRRCTEGGVRRPWGSISAETLSCLPESKSQREF